MLKKLTFIYALCCKIVLVIHLLIFYSPFRKIKSVSQTAAHVFFKIQMLASSIRSIVTCRQYFKAVIIISNKSIKATTAVVYTSIKKYPPINSCFQTVFNSYNTQLVTFEKFTESKNNYSYFRLFLNGSLTSQVYAI